MKNKQKEKDFEELQAGVRRIVHQYITGYPSDKITPYLTFHDGKYYVNIHISISNDKDDSKSNTTQLLIMQWEKALKNLFKLELGIEVLEVGVS